MRYRDILLLLGLLGCSNQVMPPVAALEATSALAPDGIAEYQEIALIGISEQQALYAASQILTEEGYAVDGTQPTLGFVMGTKGRNAENMVQRAGMAVMLLMFRIPIPIDEREIVRAGIVVRGDNAGHSRLRLTLQRIMIDSNNRISRASMIDDPALYQAFFTRLKTILAQKTP